jgi:hypothetical protein
MNTRPTKTIAPTPPSPALEKGCLFGLRPSEGRASYVSLDVVAGQPVVAYTASDDYDRVAVRQFDGSTWTAVGDPAIFPRYGSFTSLRADKSSLNLAYDNGENSDRAHVAHFDLGLDLEYCRPANSAY